MASEESSFSRNTRALRIALLSATSVALLAILAITFFTSPKEEAHAQELMYGGPLSFDMVHTHILNMKMRRSRLKERLKEAALKRKDRELAHEHGFTSGGAKMGSTPPLQQQMFQQPQGAPMYPGQPQMQQPMYGGYAPPQQPMYQQMPQQPMQQMPQQPMQQMPQQPMQQMPPQGYGQPPQQQMYQQQPPMNYEQPPEVEQPSPMYAQMPQAPAYGQQPMYPQQMAPGQAPQLAQMPPANPWGGAPMAAQGLTQSVPVDGPTESSAEDKMQQRAQAAASIQAYEAYMHGAAPAAKK